MKEAAAAEAEERKNLRSKVDLRIETGQVDVSKIDSSLSYAVRFNKQRRSSLAANEMAKDMLKGEFEDSLHLLDTGLCSKLNQAYSSFSNRRTGTATKQTNFRNSVRASIDSGRGSQGSMMVKKNKKWFQ